MRFDSRSDGVNLPVSVRLAQQKDAPDWGRIQARAMKHTLLSGLGQVSPHLLATIDAQQIAASWSSAIARPPSPKHHLLSVLAGGRVCGLLALAPAASVAENPEGLVREAKRGEQTTSAGADRAVEGAACEQKEAWAEIVALEVADWTDSMQVEHASRLLNAGADLLRACGAQGWQVWLVAGDDTHTAFYSSCGFAPTGQRVGLEVPGGKLVQHLWSCSF